MPAEVLARCLSVCSDYIYATHKITSVRETRELVNLTLLWVRAVRYTPKTKNQTIVTLLERVADRTDHAPAIEKYLWMFYVCEYMMRDPEGHSSSHAVIYKKLNESRLRIPIRQSDHKVVEVRA